MRGPYGATGPEPRYETVYGRLVPVKVGLLLALLSLGAYN
jgi:hypothetical protein